MAEQKVLQTNFSAGELDPKIGMRQDTEQYRNGARSMRNYRCLIGGGANRRPGSWLLSELASNGIVHPFVFGGAEYWLVFRDGEMSAYLKESGTAAGSVTGAPWTGDIYREMDYSQQGNTIVLTHEDMETQIVTRTGAATWSRAAFDFHVGAGSRIEQPYYKFVDPAITLLPSALTGTINVTFSDDVLEDDHVGTRFRYLRRELEIATVTGPTTGTATVIEPLPGTQDLTVTSSTGFAVGEVVEGETTGAKGTISAIPDATSIFVYIHEGLTKFAAEDLIGPYITTAISSVADATPAAVEDWEEPFFSEVRGYASCSAFHRNRILFGGQREAPNILVGSTLAIPKSFDLGDQSDGDGIMEPIGDGYASRILLLHSSEQLVVGTDHGPYYVPETSAQPFRPSSMAFFPFGSPWPLTATAKMAAFDGGVLAVSGSLVIKARPTGNQNKLWEADEVSLLSSHLVSNPVRMDITSNFSGGPERYAALVNDDGTMAILQLVEAQRIRNMVPWDTEGTYVSVAGIGGSLAVTTQRLVGGNTRYFLELFDTDLTLDLVTEYATYSALSDISVTYGGTEVNVVFGTVNLGVAPLDLDDPPAGPFYVGLDYETELEPFPPVIEDSEGSHAGDPMTITEVVVDVLTSARFAVSGMALAAYQAGDDFTADPILLNGPQRFKPMGWSDDPTVPITQTDPLPLLVRSMRMTMVY